MDEKNIPPVEESNVQGTEQVNNVGLISYLKKHTSIILLSVLIVLFSVVGGSIFGSAYASLPASGDELVKEVETEVPQDFLVPVDTFSNPIFSSWAANVKGRIKSIDNNEMKITPVRETYEEKNIITTDVENGQELSIKIIENRAVFITFVDDGAGNYTRTILKPEDIKPGMLINHGRVEIEKADDRVELIASFMTIK